MVLATSKSNMTPSFSLFRADESPSELVVLQLSVTSGEVKPKVTTQSVCSVKSTVSAGQAKNTGAMVSATVMAT